MDNLCFERNLESGSQKSCPQTQTCQAASDPGTLKECESGLTFASVPNVFRDDDGLLGQGGIKSSVLPVEAHEPILVHPKHALAELIIREAS